MKGQNSSHNQAIAIAQYIIAGLIQNQPIISDCSTQLVEPTFFGLVRLALLYLYDIILKTKLLTVFTVNL